MKKSILLLSIGLILSAVTVPITMIVSAQETELPTKIENSAKQDFELLKESLSLDSQDTQGSVIEDIPVNQLSFAEEFQYQSENQELVTYFYDDEAIEIVLYFVDDFLVYYGWTDYSSNQELIGEGYSGDQNAKIKLNSDQEDYFIIESGSSESQHEYSTHIIDSQLLTLEALFPELDILIDVTELPDIPGVEAEDASNEETELNYEEFIDEPVWIDTETNYQTQEVIEAYDSLKTAGDINLNQPDETTEVSDIYYGSTESDFVKLEVTQGTQSLVTLNNYTPDIYTAFPQDLDLNKTYSSQELFDNLGSPTIKQYNKADETERFAWIRLDNENNKVLTALLNAEGEYKIEFVETEEEAHD